VAQIELLERQRAIPTAPQPACSPAPPRRINIDAVRCRSNSAGLNKITMVPRPFRLRLATLLVVSGILGASTYANADVVERKPPRPAPDFPALEDYYPLQAKRAGQEGAVVIHICVDPGGRLTEPPRVTTSSGDELLDSAGITVAAAGSGHYIPGSENGVAIIACTNFKVNFVLRNDNPILPNDPRFPTISARIVTLSAEYNRREGDMVSRIARPGFAVGMAPSSSQSLQEIRQYARDLDSYLDLSASMTADFLDDVEYLQKSPDMPASERETFSVVWPNERATLAAQFRQLVGAARDAVRVMDDLADYLGFSVPRPRAGGQAGSPQVPAEDPQLNAIRERSRIVMERLQRAIEAVGKAAPETAR
jgi:TonB family protein